MKKIIQNKPRCPDHFNFSDNTRFDGPVTAGEMWYCAKGRHYFFVPAGDIKNE
jgi:hypothetical protein